MDDKTLKLALAASAAWRAAHDYPRQGSGWPMGAEEQAFEQVLLAVDAAGRERHDPRQMVADAAAWEAERAAWFAAAPEREAAAAKEAADKAAAAAKLDADKRHHSFYSKKGMQDSIAWMWANAPIDANRLSLKRPA